VSPISSRGVKTFLKILKEKAILHCFGLSRDAIYHFRKKKAVRKPGKQ
jgi:predicted DNA-binding transcriptional regulator AlpA